MNKSPLSMTPIACDQCGRVKVCLYTYDDPTQDYFPMVFCSIDCLSTYVAVSEQGPSLISSDRLLFH